MNLNTDTISPVERERIIQDIINHKVEEVEVGSGDAISEDELMELRSELESENKQSLVNWWKGTVGEWIASMDRFYNSEQFSVETDSGTEIPIWDSLGYENHIEWQLNKVIETGETDYGYVYPYYEQPYES